ncbi:Uncharacterized conserved protein [Mariniphaga anaerophila]|uniref:Uncharacterized conserved protein n=1 Tax=Mariniphaga anaerophila TaxID=1484053 RepID=A0A1M4T6S4_9BACT|nr:GFA family protein [Mariniphaga anaerophila]SHE40213.1 Uncharacterized conserved protein [Mariniphaga anaerophila]
MTKHRGSCLCGEVVFEVDGDFENFLLCHCKRCRKDTGSAHAANMFSSTAKLKWLSGENNVKTFRLKSTQHMRSFCAVCGSALPNIQMDGALLVVPAGCLDTDAPIVPQGHIYYAGKAKWEHQLDKLPKFDRLPPN